MSLGNLLAFSAASVAIIIAPGPFVTVIIANSLRHGARAGLLNVLGGQLGLVIWMLVALFGLSAVITSMGHWYDGLRLAGAVYLIWLGIKLWRSNGEILNADAGVPKGGFVAQGFFVTMSNPKVLLVFGALIPQFMEPSGDVTSQLLILGGLFIVLAALSDGAYAVLAGRIRQSLSKSRVQLIEKASGAFLGAGGLWLALKLI